MIQQVPHIDGKSSKELTSLLKVNIQQFNWSIKSMHITHSYTGNTNPFDNGPIWYGVVVLEKQEVVREMSGVEANYGVGRGIDPTTLTNKE